MLAGWAGAAMKKRDRSNAPKVRLTSIESKERLEQIRKLKRRPLSLGALVDELARDWLKQFRGESGPDLGFGGPPLRDK